MLILTRKSGEGIRIGEDIRVMIVDAKEGSVKLGIAAPEGMTIYRDEIYERIKQENVIAAKASSGDFNKVTDMWKKMKK
ncbi:MAG: carbon storage regulator CsrA [Deltaproteobacteria bacterium]|nr:carbon storage regulator CsrA [Deltaproteobacteria bacterium]